MNAFDGRNDQPVKGSPSGIESPRNRGRSDLRLPRSQRERRGSRKRRILIASVLIVAAGLVYLHFKSAGNPSTRTGVPPVMISTAAAKSGDIGVYVKALGTVTPLNTVSLTARVAGQISKVEYTEGQLVHIGDSLLPLPMVFWSLVTARQDCCKHSRGSDRFLIARW
jgi:membrane fusion protein, multidrug efflux system